MGKCRGVKDKDKSLLWNNFSPNVSKCKLSLATKQFRARDCSDCIVSLYSVTEPVIETSRDLSFYPYSAWFPAQQDMFVRAGLDATVNHYANVFDFSANASLLPLQNNKGEEESFKIIEDKSLWEEWKVDSLKVVGDLQNPVNRNIKTKPTEKNNNIKELISASSQEHTKQQSAEDLNKSD